MHNKNNTWGEGFTEYVPSWWEEWWWVVSWCCEHVAAGCMKLAVGKAGNWGWTIIHMAYFIATASSS